MRRFLIALMALTFATPAFPALAQDIKDLADIPGDITIVSLNVNEQMEVEQDLLIASLRYEAENQNPKDIQDEINQNVAQAIELIKALEGLKFSTQGYHVYKEERPAPKNITDPGTAALQGIWRGQQTIEIKGTNAADILTLTGKLQGMGFAMNSLEYAVSPELMEKTQDSMLESAITKLKAKAERTAKALGKPTIQILKMDVSDSGFIPQPYAAMRSMKMDTMVGGAMAEMAAPIATPGQSDISISVSAQVVLKP